VIQRWVVYLCGKATCCNVASVRDAVLQSARRRLASVSNSVHCNTQYQPLHHKTSAGLLYTDCLVLHLHPHFINLPSAASAQVHPRTSTQCLQCIKSMASVHDTSAGDSHTRDNLQSALNHASVR